MKRVFTSYFEMGGVSHKKGGLHKTFVTRQYNSPIYIEIGIRLLVCEYKAPYD